jgi:uncharacterized protein involved in exopolysaccharide biosynthesis
MKNLEVSKMTLAQETPTIQIVDSPVFPLENDKIKWYKGLFLGFFLGLFASIFVFVLKENK